MVFTREYVYAFIGGAVIHRYTGLVGTLAVSGLMLYMVDDNIYSTENINNYKETAISFIKSIIHK